MRTIRQSKTTSLRTFRNRMGGRSLARRCSPMSDRHPLRYELRCLWANLLAGMRLTFGLRIELSAFRISLAQFLALNVLLWLVAIVDDGISAGFDAHFNIFGLLQQIFFTLLLVLASFALARIYRRRELAMALPVLLTAGELPIDLCLLVLTAGDALDATPDFLRLARWWLFLIWFAFMAGRSVAVALAPSAARRLQRA